MFDIKWHDDASKEFDKLDNFVKKIILKKIDELREDPFSKDIKKLVGRDEYRFRVGNYRIVFEFLDNMIFIKKVGHRNHIYDF